MTENPNTWEKFVPWYLTVISAIMMIGIGWFIFDNILWLRGHMFDETTATNLSYRSHQYFLLVSTIRRAAGLFAGIALILLGVGVVFYVAKTQTKLNMESGGISMGIVTASPGIIAMVLGTFLVAQNTASKDFIPIFGTSPAAEDGVTNAVETTQDAFNALTGGTQNSEVNGADIKE